VGSVLRRFSIAELGQLWNVLTGDMSLVGPRPMMVNQVEAYGRPYEHYVRVTPASPGSGRSPAATKPPSPAAPSSTLRTS